MPELPLADAAAAAGVSASALHKWVQRGVIHARRVLLPADESGRRRWGYVVDVETVERYTRGEE